MMAPFRCTRRLTSRWALSSRVSKSFARSAQSLTQRPVNGRSRLADAAFVDGAIETLADAVGLGAAGFSLPINTEQEQGHQDDGSNVEILTHRGDLKIADWIGTEHPYAEDDEESAQNRSPPVGQLQRLGIVVLASVSPFAVSAGEIGSLHELTVRHLAFGTYGWWRANPRARCGRAGCGFAPPSFERAAAGWPSPRHR